MITVWKFEISPDDDVAIDMPRGAALLHVATQGAGERPCLWALVDTAAPVERRRFRVYGTGHQIYEGEQVHVGSWMMYGDALVFHLFEVIES